MTRPCVASRTAFHVPLRYLPTNAFRLFKAPASSLCSTSISIAFASSPPMAANIARTRSQRTSEPRWVAWEGDTLIVDVTSFNGKIWLADGADKPTPTSTGGWFTSEALHVVERWCRVDLDTLEYQATVEDPKVLTGPLDDAEGDRQARSRRRDRRGDVSRHFDLFIYRKRIQGAQVSQNSNCTPTLAKRATRIPCGCCQFPKTLLGNFAAISQ